MITLEQSPLTSDPTVLSGALVFRGARVPVQTLLDYLNDGYSLDHFLPLFPSVRRADAEQLIELTLASTNWSHSRDSLYSSRGKYFSTTSKNSSRVETPATYVRKNRAPVFP